MSLQHISCRIWLLGVHKLRQPIWRRPSAEHVCLGQETGEGGKERHRPGGAGQTPAQEDDREQGTRRVRW